MKKVFSIFTNLLFTVLAISLFAVSSPAAMQKIEQPLDFRLVDGSNFPAENQMFYGYTTDLVEYRDWLNRPSSDALSTMIFSSAPPPLAVFEARSAGVVRKPISFFSKDLFENLTTIQKLDPENVHRVIPQAPKKPGLPPDFVVETTIKFPQKWARYINDAKNRGLLNADKSDALIIESTFNYQKFNQATASDKALKNVNKLNIYNRDPEVITSQVFTKINEVAKFGSQISFFYRLDDEHTLIVNYFTLAIKKKDINPMGIPVGTAAFMGTSSLLSTDYGIGAGLPNYVEALFKSIYSNWN